MADRLLKIQVPTPQKMPVERSSAAADCHPIYSGRQACGRTSRGHTEERSHEFLHLPSAVLALIFLAKRIHPSFPSSTVGLNFVYQRINRSPLVGHFFFFFFFSGRKNPGLFTVHFFCSVQMLWFPRTADTNGSRLWFSHYRGWSMDGSGETRLAAVRVTVPG